MHTLTERWYAWEEARKIAKDDPEIDLTGQRQAYNPRILSVSNSARLYNNHLNLVQDEYDDDDYLEADPDTAGPESDKFGEAHVKAGKDLPKADFFNTPQDPPTLKEKMAQKVKRVLPWSK